jgi:cytochrome c oxidase subunit 3
MAHHDHAQQDHPFHLVNSSPWPLASSMSLLLVTLGATLTMHGKPHGALVLIAGIAAIVACAFFWWRDVVREAVVDKAHTPAVQLGLRYGMALFIVSEVMFFAAFFWAYFDRALYPSLPLEDIWSVAAGVWPPAGIKTFDPFDLPFLNTLILLLSGTTVTWAHHAILEDKRDDGITAMWFTVILGACFTGLQALEYSHAAFGFKDGVYASTFYLLTGFHGLHVIIGTIFLAVNLVRLYKNQVTSEGHLGFEMAAWYWHFVDVVWIFLFIFVYWLGA